MSWKLCLYLYPSIDEGDHMVRPFKGRARTWVCALETGSVVRSVVTPRHPGGCREPAAAHHFVRRGVTIKTGRGRSKQDGDGPELEFHLRIYLCGCLIHDCSSSWWISS